MTTAYKSAQRANNALILRQQQAAVNRATKPYTTQPAPKKLKNRQDWRRG